MKAAKLCLMGIAFLLLVNGCKNRQDPDEEVALQQMAGESQTSQTMVMQVPSTPAATAAPSAPAIVTSGTSAAASGPKMYKLTGRELINNDFTTESMVAPGVLGMKHYGAIKRDFELTSPFKKATLTLGVTTNTAAFPKAYVRLHTTSGKYRDWVFLNNELVKEKTEITTESDFAKGKYQLTVGYYKSEPDNARPPLHFHSFVLE